MNGGQVLWTTRGPPTKDARIPPRLRIEIRFSFQLFKWWVGTESNRRHMPFQGIALPTELPTPSEEGILGKRSAFKRQRESLPFAYSCGQFQDGAFSFDA